MFFKDYLELLKKHFKVKPPNEKLFNLLVDSIVEPAELTHRNGEVFILEKADISLIINRKRDIPRALQDHVYDKVVLDGINEYFQTNIVSELAPDQADLCHKMMKLIDADQDISPERKADFRVLANPSTIAAFLAEAFIYVIRQDNKLVSEPIATSKSDEPLPEGYAFPPNYKHKLSEYNLQIQHIDEERIKINLTRD